MVPNLQCELIGFNTTRNKTTKKMKKLLLLLVGLTVAAGAYAQGTVNMNTFGGGVNARASNTVANTWAGLDGQTWNVGLYYGAPGAASSTFSLAPVTASFGTAAATAGYVLTSTGGGTRAIPSVAGGSQVQVQIRAWTGAFATYEAALAAATGLGGTSSIVTVTLGTPPLGTPAPMTGMTAFNVQSFGPVVPEPSSIALGLLGLGAIVLFRRRK